MTKETDIFWGLREELILKDVLNSKEFKPEYLYQNENINLTDDNYSKAKNVAEKLNLTLETVLLVKIIDTILKIKKEKYKKYYPNSVIIDIYELAMNSYILYLNDIDIKIITPYELQESIDFF